MTRVKTDVARGALEARLTQAGYSLSDTQILASHLLQAELFQVRSHGIRRLPGILADAATAARATPTITNSRGGLQYAANGQQGIVALQSASIAASSRAKAEGIVIAAVTGFTGTTGELGSYTRWLATKGLVAIAFCSSEYAVAPYGSSRAILGTNPIAIGFPTDDQPFSADIATAAWSYGRIKEVERAGGELPLGVVIDASGLDSTDPRDADEGSQLPMAGHKGYALGLAVELLAGPLIGAKAGRDAVPGGDGALLIVIDASLFRAESDVVQDVVSLFGEIRRAPLRAGSEGIHIPGEGRSEGWPDEIDISTESMREIGLD